MIVQVNHDTCVGHGRCFELAPEIFEEGEDGRCCIIENEIVAPDEERAREAAINCPERAISIVEDTA
jgi:ferredoxin